MSARSNRAIKRKDYIGDLFIELACDAGINVISSEYHSDMESIVVVTDIGEHTLRQICISLPNSDSVGLESALNEFLSIYNDLRN